MSRLKKMTEKKLRTVTIFKGTVNSR